MGKEMEEAGNEWTCPNCSNKVEKEKTEKQTFQLKVKLKERQATKKSTLKTPTKESKSITSPPGADQGSSPDKNKKQVTYFGTTISKLHYDSDFLAEINHECLVSNAVFFKGRTPIEIHHIQNITKQCLVC
jgi:uncharacterized Zn finger protein (UPF0148 family)